MQTRKQKQGGRQGEQQQQELSNHGETQGNLLRRQQLFWFLQIPKSSCLYLHIVK